MRPAKIWQRTGKPGWYATIAGKKVLLGTDREAAQREFHRLKAAGRPVERGCESVALLVDLSPCARPQATSRRPRSRTHRWYLQQWVNFAGHRPAAGLKPLDVRQHGFDLVQDGMHPLDVWRRRWFVGGRGGVKHKDTLTADTLAGARSPRGVPRAAARPEDIAAFLSAVTCPLLRDIAIVLLDTGARPGEIRTLTAGQINWADSTAMVEGKTGPRVISLTGRSLATLANLATLYPTGPLFRNRAGRIWTRSQLCYRFRVISKRANVYVFPYHFRHDFYRRASKAGVPDLHVMKQLGHTDLKMLATRYSHVDSSQTKEAVEKAARS